MILRNITIIFTLFLIVIAGFFISLSEGEMQKFIFAFRANDGEIWGLKPHILNFFQLSGNAVAPIAPEEKSLPLRVLPFEKGEETVIKAFFNNSNLDPEFSCNKVFPVERTVAKNQNLPMKSLELLFEGPTAAEKEEGFLTSLPSGVAIQSLKIENGVATVDFNEALEFQVGGSCRVAAIRWQIMETLKQFPEIREVIISINGRTEDILQP